MIRFPTFAALCVLAGFASQVAAQGLYVPPVDTSQMATKADVSALQAQVPQPASTVPPTETVAGAAGATATYRRGDAVQPRITRAATVSTDASGNWTVTWSTALATAPVTLPIPITAGATPIVCNVATSTTTGATGRCWLARTLPATITVVTSLASYDVFGGSPGVMSVQVLAIPPTQ